MIQIRISFDNGDVFEIPAQFVAEARAKYYARLDVDRGYEDDYQTAFDAKVKHAMKDSYELIDWLCNTMNWSDVEKVAVRLPNPRFNYIAGWENAGKEVVKVP